MAGLKTYTELKDSFIFEVYYTTEITNIKYKFFYHNNKIVCSLRKKKQFNNTTSNTT